MRTRRLFLLSFALTGATAIVSSVGCSSSPAEEPSSQAEADLTEADDDVGGESEADDTLTSDPESEPDADPLACTGADPAEGLNERNVNAELQAGQETDTEEELALADEGSEAEADADNAGEDESSDEIDGIPGEAEADFPLDTTASVMAKIPSKIKYVMVLVKENHTFDNYFTGFPGANSTTHAKLHNGKVIRRPMAPNGTIGKPCHSNHCGQQSYRGGAMDGFDLASNGITPFIRYGEQQIPNYWAYAKNFVLADHMFSTTLGPSSPGHEVFWFSRSTTIDNPKCHKKGGCGAGVGCAAEKGLTATAFNPVTCHTKKVKPCFNLPSLPDHMPHGFTWMDYGGPMAMQIKSVVAEQGHKKHFRTSHQLVKDLEAGHLANLTIAHLSGGAISEHPPESPCNGENFTVDVINAAMKLPQWKEMAIVVTWDDYGGFYDHVKPKVHKCANGKIMGNGFRLPLIVISPYAKKGHVLKNHTEQASVPRLVEELWGMSFMHSRNKRARDAVAGSLLGAFDFNQAPRDPLFLKPRKTCP